MTQTVLLTGATGFVGRYAYPALIDAGYRVRCATRDVSRARRRYPDREWVFFDLALPSSIRQAMAGCDSALFLIHQLHAGGDYPRREFQGARRFARAAEKEGLRRIVYLGGVEPDGPASRHLRSRLDTGKVLRESAVSTIELRAAMIIGEGSESWQMVRDLAERLPLMVLPRWLGAHSWPVAIDDVVAAMLVALGLSGSELGGSRSVCYDVPGPERLSHRQTLEYATALIGRSPRLIDVPVVTPQLSSYWIAMVTGVDRAMARELVAGIRYDLDPTGPRIWQHVPGYQPTDIRTAMALALIDAGCGASPTARARARTSRLALGALQRIPRVGHAA